VGDKNKEKDNVKSRAGDKKENKMEVTNRKREIKTEQEN
jgi:hypothetical protein